MSSSVPRINKSEVIGEGKWLRLLNVHYTDENNRDRIWETLERTTHGRAEVDGRFLIRIPDLEAVEIVPIVLRKDKEPHIIVIKQFRPPTGKFIIELPAGLVDKDEPVTVAALRELKEETGYSGTIADESMETIFGMAISSTTCKIVTVEIDGDKPENINPKQHLEEGEFAEVISIPLYNMMPHLEEYKKKGCGIDAKLIMMAVGMNVMKYAQKSNL